MTGESQPMKPRTLLIAILALAFVGTWWSQAQTAAKPTTKEIMAEKLDYAHFLLNGIATENFDLLANNAEKLNQLSQSTVWRQGRTPEYEALSADFRRHVVALTKAAKDRNLDAASLAYVQISLSCVNCHKYMRGVKTAELH
jgi:cytochrome c556